MPAADGAGPPFDPLSFFEGRTEGRGLLRLAFGGSKAVHVSGTGVMQPDGTLALEQIVRVGDEPTRTRSWRMRRIGPGRYAGTLTDASGPVSAEMEGRRLHIRYEMKNGMNVDQHLALGPDPATAQNAMSVGMLGFRAAAVEETIRRLD